MAKANVWCFGVACPWCLLEADHGDYSAAQQSYQKAVCGSSLRERPHLANAAWHAISDIVEQAQRNGIDPGIPTLYPQPSYAAESWPHANLAPSVIAATAAASSAEGWLSHGGASTSSTVPPAPPARAPREQWSGDHAARPSWKKAKKAEPAPIPPERACFQVWGGRGTKWITYEETVQTILREAYSRHARVNFVGPGGKNYEVDTHPDVMTQKRTDLHPDEQCNARTVRVVPREDDLFAV